MEDHKQTQFHQSDVAEPLFQAADWAIFCAMCLSKVFLACDLVRLHSLFISMSSTPPPSLQASGWRPRTPSQMRKAAGDLKAIIDGEDSFQPPPESMVEIIAEADNVVPPELHFTAKSMLGIDVDITLKDNECAIPEKELPDELLSLIKSEMLAQAGGGADSWYEGELDPWSKLVREVTVTSSGEGTKYNFVTFPTNLGFLSNLETLVLSNHSFSSLPSNIAALGKLQTLTIEKTKLKSSSEIGQGCAELACLVLNDNRLSSASKSLSSLSKLRELHLRNNQISSIYSEYSALKSLRVLNLAFNRISKIPAELRTLDALEVLDLSNNALGTGLMNRSPLTPVSFMVSLVQLDLSNNKLSSLPPLASLAHLEILNVSGNSLTELPSMGVHDELQILLAADNMITSVPLAVFKGMRNLRVLDLCKNKCRFIPSSLEALESLNELHLAQNQISTVPDSLGKLLRLTLLDLSGNDLVVVQNGIFSCLHELRELRLHGNRISRLPEDLFNMQCIQEIDLSNNAIGELPKVPEHLLKGPFLQRISFANNQLNTLPTYLASFTRLRLLHLRGNPISGLPDELCGIDSLELLSIFNLSIHYHKKMVEVIDFETQEEKDRRKKDKDAIEVPLLAHIQPLMLLARNCTHPLLVFALAELAGSRVYHEELIKYLSDFLLFLSHQRKEIVVDAIRGLGGLALHSEGRRALVQSPLLFQSILAISNRDSHETMDVTVAALKALSHLCLDEEVATSLYHQGLEGFIQKELHHEDQRMREGCRKILNCVGYTGHLNKRLTHLPSQRGVRILCLDGGGTKSVSTVGILIELERITGKRIHQLFDLICGTSVGGILSCLFGVACLGSEEVGTLQKRFFKEIFSSGAKKAEGWGEKVALLSNLFSTGGRYNTAVFEKILRELFGEDSLIDTSSLEEVTRVFVAAIHMDVYPPDPFLFRNYTYRPGVKSRYPGNCERKVWEAIRATSAAPSMFTECVYGMWSSLSSKECQSHGSQTQCASLMEECRSTTPRDLPIMSI